MQTNYFDQIAYSTSAGNITNGEAIGYALTAAIFAIALIWVLAVKRNHNYSGHK